MGGWAMIGAAAVIAILPNTNDVIIHSFERFPRNVSLALAYGQANLFYKKICDAVYRRAGSKQAFRHPPPPLLSIRPTYAAVVQ